MLKIFEYTIKSYKLCCQFKVQLMFASVTMASLLESYEQQYGTLTSEITNKIGTIAKLRGGKFYIFAFEPLISILV